MTYLELCQLLREESGLQGSGPVSVLNQSGMLAKMIRWIEECYVELLSEERWTFLWRRATTTLVAGTDAYATLPGLTDVGLIFAWQMWNASNDPRTRITFKDFYAIDELAAASDEPRYFTRRPDQAIVFYPNPDDAYDVRLDYLATGHTLSADGDVPIIPDARLHPLIAYRALVKYGTHNEDYSAIQRGLRESERLYSILHDKYGPKPVSKPVPIDQIPDETSARLV